MHKELPRIQKYNSFYKANAALVAGYYPLAVALYTHAYNTEPLLQDMVSFNLRYTLSEMYGEVSEERLAQVIHKKEAKKSLLNTCKDTVLLTERQLKAINIDEEEGIYIANNNDPYFMLDADVTRYQTGLYGLSFYLFSNDGIAGQVGKLYVDYGDGFSEDNTISIPLQQGLNERLMHLPESPVSLRFDPLEIQTQFVVLDFEMTTIDESKVKTYFDDIFSKNKVLLDSQDEPIMNLYLKYDELIKSTNKGGGYEQWLAVNESSDNDPVPSDIAELESLFSSSPLFSIVIPTYNTEEKYLRACIDSILAQSFGSFELCIADDCSPDEHVREVLGDYEALDSRVKVVYRQKNGHISKASNSAIEMATGRYIVLVDHDDMLAEHALYYCAQAIDENPDIKILYSDEDKIDEHGVRSNPHFKSDWNPDLLYSQNYVSHLGVYDTELVKRIGGFRVGVEGSQDYDLLLRCLPYVNDSQITHIPRVLYHWRAIVGSTAVGAGEKSYTTDAGIKALQDYFDTNGPSGARVTMGKVPNTYKVDWPIPNPMPKVSMLIPTRDGKDITEQAVRSILEKTTYPNYDILIIDNGSEKQETFDFFEQIQADDSRVSVIRYDHPFNYSAINNFGAAHTDGDIIGLINNDVEVINPEWLTEMVMHTIRPDIGCVGAKLYYANGQIQHAGVILGIGGVAGHSHKYAKDSDYGYFSRLLVIQNLSAVTAACLLVKRSVYDEVGGLNEADLTVAFNDVDFCLRVYSAGYRNLWTPYAELYHHESISRGAEDNPEKVARFNKEADYMKLNWTELLNRDPHYNPNLTKIREDFSMNI
ncbi:glycosyltransferase family 2 protein [Psychrobacter celer]|uniref:glycosyltransferase family 2 protein n=1 Tax=Psychrobacter celer TaxID=306572 RepID=UPI003FD3FE03